MTANWDEEADEALLAAIATSNHRAYASLVRRHTSRFYAVAYRFMGNREMSQDIVQEAFIKLWERPDLWKSDQSAKFTTWFYRIVVNRCMDQLKSKKPLPLAEGADFADDRVTQDVVMEESQRRRWLEKGIRELPERQQAALNLCFYEGLSNQEAAKVMGMNLKGLQSLLMRAKASLKIKMQAIQ